MAEFSLLTVTPEGVKTGFTCSACDLCADPRLVTNCMSGMGPENVDLMFVGRAPMAEDDTKGEPYSGRTGELFKQLLIEAQIPINKVYITNCVKCTPYEDKVKEKHFKACKSHLIKEINRVKPKAIVAVGAQALNWLTGLSGIKQLRRHGLPCSIYDGLTVYPLEQPAALFHVNGNAKQQLRKQMVEDLRWLKNKAKQGTLNEADSTHLDYRMVENIRDFEEVMEELMQQDELCCDLETSSLFPDEGEVIVAIGFSWGAGIARSIPLYAWGLNTLHFWTDEQVEQKILPALRNLFLSKKFFGHNFIQFDQKWIRRDFNLDTVDITFDTQVAHYLLDEEKGTHDLEQLALKYTSMSPWKKDFTIQDIRKLCKYLHKDVDATWRIRQQLEPQLTERQNWLLHTLMIPLGHELMRMEHKGVLVSTESVEQLSNWLESELTSNYEAIHKIDEVKAFELDNNVTVNVESPKHLGSIMQDYLRLPLIKRTGSGAYSTDSEVLDAFAHVPFVQLVQQRRRLMKLYGTYCEGMKNVIRKDGCIHTNYLEHGTTSGRLASRNPNLQNIPREDTVEKAGLEDGKLVKNIFRARPGYVLLQMDLSQAELRTIAAYSGDKNLIGIYERNEDAHTATAALVNGVPLDQVTKAQRTAAKCVNFGLIYGKTLQGLIEDFLAAGSTREAAISFYEGHKKTFPQVWEFLEAEKQKPYDPGYQETYFGRRRRYKGEIDDHSLREAMNFPIQSTASDFCLFILVRSARFLRKLGLDAYPLLTVHDSVIYEIKKEHFDDAFDAIKVVVDSLGFEDLLGSVKMEADYEHGELWGNMEKIK